MSITEEEYTVVDDPSKFGGRHFFVIPADELPRRNQPEVGRLHVRRGSPYFYDEEGVSAVLREFSVTWTLVPVSEDNPVANNTLDYSNTACLAVFGVAIRNPKDTEFNKKVGSNLSFLRMCEEVCALGAASKKIILPEGDPRNKAQEKRLRGSFLLGVASSDCGETAEGFLIPPKVGPLLYQAIRANVALEAGRLVEEFFDHQVFSSLKEDLEDQLLSDEEVDDEADNDEFAFPGNIELSKDIETNVEPAPETVKSTGQAPA